MKSLTKLLLSGAVATLIPTLASAAPVITQNSDASALANSIAGAGITILNTPTLTGTAVQSGTFTNGTADIGIESGVVLSTGNVNEIAGANGTVTDLSTSLGGAGDAALSTIVGGAATDDASILDFDFQFGDGSVGGDLFFEFVFGSEEYLEFVDSEFNDVFGFFLDDVNVALTDSGDPISINSINPDSNAELYRDNPGGAGVFDVRLDGLTTVIQIAIANVAAGTHNFRFAIADTADGSFDSAIFIGGSSFSTGPDPTSEVPLPAALPLMMFGAGAIGFASRRRKQKNA